MTTQVPERNRSILNGIVHHNTIVNAYLFHGPASAFLKDAGFYFAASIFCPNVSLESGPCQSCDTCDSVYNESLSDFFYISEEKMGIDTIRSIQELIKYGPTSHSRLVMIIDHVEHMSLEAANAFLKSLEEPPLGVTFVLLTHSPMQLLPTIRSRCQLLDFPKASLDHLNHAVSQALGNDITHLTSSELLTYQYQQNVPIPFDIMSYDALSQMPLVDRFKFAESLSKYKPLANACIMMWLRECMEKGHAMSQKDTQNMQKMIELLSKMKYNLNQRLQLETLMVAL